MANRLIREKSPYLLQHAHNPVDWYPWGDEAFEAARELDRPVFLSIGYATCHWCHVMERESFEDAEVARLLNRTFVSVKVDREERPDIDGIYMTVAQLTTGRGGWPLTILMTPDRTPFFAATYIARESRHGSIGMLDLVPRIEGAWTADREALLAAGASIREHLERLAGADLSGRSLGADTVRAGFNELAGAYDRQHAGFGDAPRFPASHRLLFLLRHWRRTGVAQARDMVEEILDAMRAGGLYDHLGGGFHRYSTDREWRLPHFEKMLYDQAMLMLAYTESYQVEPSARREATVRDVASYVMRDLASETGGFFSAEDADSEGEEGKFYVWSREEIDRVLGPATAGPAALAWGVTEEGNYEDEATHARSGLNILHLARPLGAAAGAAGLTVTELAEHLSEARSRLFAHREARERPLLDDKILTDWNGLMVAALARAGHALAEPDFLAAARRAADFLHDVMWTDGELLHRFRDGDAAIAGNLDDYAFLAWGEIELHQAGQDTRHLRRAIDLTDAMVDRFHDGERGGFFFSPANRRDLIVRRKELYDGAVPSGNSVALYNLLRLARLTGSVRYETLAAETAGAFSRQVAAQPSAFAFFLAALDMALEPSQELVIVGEPNAEDTLALLNVAWEGYHPNRVVLVRPPGDDPAGLEALAPFTRGFATLDGRAAAYLCSGFACERPTAEPAVLRGLLDAVE